MSQFLYPLVKLLQLIIREFQTLALLTILIYILVRKSKSSHLNKLINRIPGPAGLPLLGNSIECNVDNEEIFNRITSSKRLFGHKSGVTRIWLGRTPYVFIHTAENAEPILNNSRTISKSSDYRYIQPWLGNGLLTSSGELWHQRRKILTPAFHFRILEDFVSVFQEQSTVLVDKMEREIGMGQIVNVFPYVTLCTLDIVCETAMGRKINAQEDSNSDYVKAVYEIGSIIQKRQAKIYLQPDILFKFSSLFNKHQNCLSILHSFSYKVINERREELKKRRKDLEKSEYTNLEHKIKRMAFLDLLIEASDRYNLSNEDIREEVDTFMFEGHDTTSAAICWALLLLGSDQDIQNKVYEEILCTFDRTSSGKPFTTRSLNSMKYLEACIKEALRLYPSVPFIARKLNEDVRLKEYVLPRDTEAIIVVYNVHRDPKFFPRPEVYDPNRFFLPETSSGRHPYSYIPFSAGPRNCIGQKFAMLEEKVILANILQRFRVEAVDRREDLTLLGELILRPKDGIRVKLFPR
ncbi:hypothetical protein WDU94_011365 [Cyamophila willieti]